MKKIFTHIPLVLINLPAVLINISLVGIKAYNNNPIVIAPKYIISTFVFYIIWLLYGFFMGKKSGKSFLYFAFIYWGITLLSLVLGSTIDGLGAKHSVLTIFALFNIIPQYSVYTLLENIYGMSNSTMAVFTVIIPIFISTIGYYLGRLHIYFFQIKNS